MVTTASGLQYEDIVAGTDASPSPGETVSVHYTGTLTAGSKFDSSRDRGQPFQFVIGVGKVIQRELRDPLAMRILYGEFRNGDTLVVDDVHDKLAFSRNGQISQAA